MFLRLEIVCSEPLLKFAECPNTFFLVFTLSTNDEANTMLHAVYPLTTILTTIRIGVSSEAVLLV